VSYKHAVIKLATLMFGTTPRLRRVPFGPIRGRQICIAPQISLRMQLGIDEGWAMKTANKLLSPGDVAYDVGAHIGYTALVLAQAVAPGGEVHAFEIHPKTLNLLRRTIEANTDLSIRIHRVGLGSGRHDIKLTLTGSSMMASLSSAGTGEVCHVEPLDEYIAENHLPLPRLIKVDIEGAEIDFLNGAASVLREVHPALVIEFHGRARLNRGLELLRSLGYREFTCSRPGRLVRSDRFHESVLCTQ
jgi:FkbM family methyltransferase